MAAAERRLAQHLQDVPTASSTQSVDPSPNTNEDNKESESVHSVALTRHIRNTHLWIAPSPRKKPPSLQISITPPDLDDDPDPSIEDSFGTIIYDPSMDETDKKSEREPREHTPSREQTPEEVRQESIMKFEKKKKKTRRKNKAILIFLMVFIIACFCGALLYTVTSSSSKCHGYTINPGSFCFVAGITSAALFVVSGYAWWRGERRQLQERAHKSRNKRKKTTVKESKATCDSYTNLVLCVTFWNILWSVFGILVYIEEMDWDCRLEPVSIVMFLWCALQFSWACVFIFIIMMMMYVMGEDILTTIAKSVVSSFVGDE